MEKFFGIYQTAKILYISGFDNFNQFIDPKKDGPRVKQDVNVLDYHIIKGAVIQDINGFLAIFMNKENKGKVAAKYRAFIERKLRDGSYQKKVDVLIKAFKEDLINNQKRWKKDKDRVVASASLYDTGRTNIIESKI